MRDFHLPGRSAVYATNGMCATSHPLAAKVAVQMLESGGNAVDAAIAGAVLLGICEPQMTGIGGDCFVLLSPAGEDRVVALNGSGRAPKGLSAAALRNRGLATVPVGSADAVTVPGAVDAFCRLSKDWGRIGLKASLAPAIHYAEQGVPVAPRVQADWAQAEGALQGSARDHYLSSGRVPQVGEVFRAPKQAEVLRRIAMDGREGFYEGEVAEDMVAALRAAGGSHTLDDFAAAACDYVDPISGHYKGVELVEHPPNGHGATAILLANILSNFDLSAMDPFGADRAHVEAEAAKLAYDTRNRFLADADYMTRLDHMLSAETAAKLAGLIDMKRALPDAKAASEAVHRDTVYITVVDKDRMSVSLIYSIYHSFGSGLASNDFGILFQNRGAGFTLEEGHPNEAAGGKRPMHTIIPAMLRENGRVTMPFGVMGGAYQPNGHARFMTNMVDFGMHPQEAIDSPRAFADAGELRVERGYSDTVRAELVERGHKVVEPDTAIGGAQAIRLREDGVLEGASDPRKDGSALGY
ncbi:gamma-glutamyltransferase family protein [Tranquillimonas alkanivorans]|uniref:Gamma-glutamyltransferase 2. Threonine peptidase. MEROPS family T03 n=1 Tax=Tranquillimonas alkanivorans TaxID=441119 RepID=A0A1I5L840_9RHOB|nr:gamma-glutamyltransferase family protein [Tranquillimonas alkanivorans]SFO93450.1 gamma-glutamyltransferase 2. Threonine peptidase. MEROPS family T03 [Tranquillimonas alkanivorans]